MVRAQERGELLGVRSRSWRAPLLAALVALVAVLFGSAVRIHTALTDEAFRAHDPRGLLRSDPALLLYVTERIADAEGLVPEGWRADPRIEHPDAFDVPASLTVGQELLVAWCDRMLGARVPLHATAVWVMGIVASLAAAAVLALALELTGSLAWSALATVVFVLVPASYRTIGFVLVNEDLSLPLVLAHLWLAARAARVQSVPAFAWAGASAGAALATWHATSFFVALEAAAILVGFLVSGRNPFAPRRSWVAVAVAAAVALAVPALRAKLTVLSPPFAVVVALIGARAAAGRKGGAGERALALALLVLLLGAGAAASRALAAGWSDFSHVWRVVAAKLAHLGVPPADPSVLSFEARLLWQGPFETLAPARALATMQLALVLGVPAAAAGLVALARTRAAGPREVLAVLLAGALVAAWLVERVSVLATPLAAVAGAVLLQRIASARARWLAARETAERRAETRGAAASMKDAGDAPAASASAAAGAAAGDRSLALLAARAAPLAVVAVLAAQALGFARWRSGIEEQGLAWYRPRVRIDAIAQAIGAVERLVPPDEAVAADFMLSAAVLAQTRRPIVLQPKWERRESRERVEAFWSAFYHGTPEDLRTLLVERLRCTWLLVDHGMLGELRASRRLAGLAADEPLPPRSAASVLLASGENPPAPPCYTRAWSWSDPTAPSITRFDLWKLER